MADHKSSEETAHSAGSDHHPPTDQLLDFHPSCVGHVTARHPAYCVVNNDIYVSNKLLEHLPAPIRVGRTQLRVTVKSVNQGNFRWKAVSAWPVAEADDRAHDEESRPRSSSILAAVSEVPETSSSALALEITDSIGWVRRQVQRVRKEHDELSTLLAADDSVQAGDQHTRTRTHTLLTTAADALTTALSAYTELVGLLHVHVSGGDAAPTPSPIVSPTRNESLNESRMFGTAHATGLAPVGSTPVSTLGSLTALADESLYAQQRREAAEAAAGTRRRSVSERVDARGVPMETDINVVGPRLRALFKEGRPLPPGPLLAVYQQRYRVALEPTLLGYPRLNSLLKALNLPYEQSAWGVPTDDPAQLCAAMETILRLNGAMPIDALSAQLSDRGIVLPGPTAEVAAAFGFPISGEMIACRTAPQMDAPSAYPLSPFDPSRDDLFSDGWATRPRAASAPHPPFPSSSPWDDTWSPQQSPTHGGWEGVSQSALNAVSPPRPGQQAQWEENLHGPGSASPTASRRPSGRGCTKLFVGGINPVTTERTLSRYFVRFGRLVDCFIAKTPGAGPNFAPRSRGFGFVTFAHSSSAEMVLRSGPHVLDDRALDVKTAVPKELMQPTPSPQGWPQRAPPSPFRHGFGGPLEHEGLDYVA